MKKPFLSKLLFGAALMSLTLVSCKDEEKAAPATQNASQNNATQNTSAENSNEKATAQLNPEHGLPGHRCDLPVGAPLNGASPAQTIQARNTSTPSTNVSPIRLNQTPAVNPPHGQPGHDCAVPVGAALE